MSWLSTLDKDGLRCRRLGHSWDEINWYNVPGGYTGLTIRCTSCRTERFDIYDRVGELAKRKYIYEDWYKKPRDEDRPTAPDMRLVARGRAKGNIKQGMTSAPIAAMARRLKG